MKFAHVYQDYVMSDDTLRRHLVAKRSWDKYLSPRTDVVTRPFHITADTRTADRLVGDPRNVPYINDIVDFGFADPSVDAVIFTNNDVGFLEDPVPYITEQVKAHGGCFMRRLDFKTLSGLPTTLKGAVPGGGADLFAFSRAWWQQVREALPLMFVGTEGFDFVLGLTLFISGFDAARAKTGLYHEQHRSFWKRDKQTLQHSPAQQYNRDVCRQWVSARGYSYMLQRSGFLFHPFSKLRPRKPRQAYNIGLVVLGRYGDIINALPVGYHMHTKGLKVLWAVREEYVSIFDGVSYITPHPLQCGLAEVRKAAQAIHAKCDHVLCLQMLGNPHVGKRRTSSFAMEMWRMANLTSMWEHVPLLFDRRDCAREQELAAATLGSLYDSRPILFAGSGTSSPFAASGECLRMCREIADRYDTPILDISNVRATRIYDMLGLIERASALITIDSSLLHLAYAATTPTFALVSEGPRRDRSNWYGSQPRSHWRAQARYSRWQEILAELSRWFDEQRVLTASQHECVAVHAAEL